MLGSPDHQERTQLLGLEPYVSHGELLAGQLPMPHD